MNLICGDGFGVADWSLGSEHCSHIIQVFMHAVVFGSLLAVIMLFAPAAIIIGMVTPYAFRLALQPVPANQTGRMLG